MASFRSKSTPSTCVTLAPDSSSHSSCITGRSGYSHSLAGMIRGYRVWSPPGKGARAPGRYPGRGPTLCGMREVLSCCTRRCWGSKLGTAVSPRLVVNAVTNRVVRLLGKDETVGIMAVRPASIIGHSGRVNWESVGVPSPFRLATPPTSPLPAHARPLPSSLIAVSPRLRKVTPKSHLAQE